MDTTHDDNTNLRVASFSCYLDKDKDNLVRRIISSQETPILLTSTTKPMSPILTINPRVDSFSYNNRGENFMFNVPGPVKDPTSTFTFPKTTPKGGEISIFGADKYFNMKLEYPTGLQQGERPVTLGPIGLHTIKKPVNSSSCSEASSWNSQGALLQGVGSQKHLKKPFGRRIFAGFGCRGPCFDKKGVHINAYYGPNPNRVISPIPNHGPENNLAVKKQMEVENINHIDESRPSIEVFGSRKTPSKGNNIVATNMERKLSMLTWDAIPKAQNVTTSKTSTICDDMASDASSDLFEIENISGSIYPISTIEGHENDDVSSSCMSPTTSHYAPSEASIQWSVVTASAADYSSIIYDYNDETSVSVVGETMNKSPKKRNEGQKARPGGLLGCKSHKAVDVAENMSIKTNDLKTKQHHGMDLSVSYGKSQGNRVRVKDVETLKLPRSFDSSGFSL